MNRDISLVNAAVMTLATGSECIYDCGSSSVLLTLSVPSVDTRWKAFWVVPMLHHVWRLHKWSSGELRESGGGRGLLQRVKGHKSRVMIISYSFSGFLHHACTRTNTYTHTLSPFPIFLAAIISPPRGSPCQFLARLIIALLASPCNGPILSNLERWTCTLSMTKDYFIDPSLSPPPPCGPSVSFLHFFMPISNFLTAILCCFLPMGSHDPMQYKASAPVDNSSSCLMVDDGLRFLVCVFCSFFLGWLTQSATDCCFYEVLEPPASLQNVDISFHISV